MEKIFAQDQFSFEIVRKVARSSPILFPLCAILSKRSKQRQTNSKIK